MRNQTLITDYYREQALAHGHAADSTMLDLVVRQKEVDALLGFLRWASGRLGPPTHKLLEIGCGNGHMLERICAALPGRFEATGVDITPEQIDIARRRGLPCRVEVGDILRLGFDDATFDIAISERVIINLLDEEEQVAAYHELARVVRPGGLVILIEGFKSGLENLNRARAEFCLEPIPEPKVNNWYTPDRWARFLEEGFVELPPEQTAGLAPENFLSSHYFMTRFFHDVIRPAGGKLRNTEMAMFFAQALPAVGDYSPLRVKYLRRV